jgi:ribonuclease HII
LSVLAHTFEPIEEAYRALGFSAICGIDEAGRGPLAGDVYAAAVILPPAYDLPYLNDSKKLTPKRRDALFDAIQTQALAVAIATASVAEIEQYNILQAALLAMQRAVQALPIPPDCALVDGNKAPILLIPTETIIKGDSRCASVAAASVLAKVARDRYMTALDSAYPGYGFAEHKGYGTKAHYEAIEKLGLSPAHRQSFIH